MLEKGHKIRYKKWCPVEEKYPGLNQKGFEVTKNSYIVGKEEIDKMKLKTINTVEKKDFIEVEVVKIHHEIKKIPIGRVVLREKKPLVALRAYQRGLVMNELRHLDEIGPVNEIDGIDASQKVDAAELSLGKALVDNLSVEKFDPGQCSDTYAKVL